MIACVDVDYRESEGMASAACVLFQDWCDHKAHSTVVKRCAIAAKYAAGKFYERELPCILAVLSELDELPEVILVDGYAWLSQDHEPGLGAHLHAALQQRVVVIGVAKNPYEGSDSVEVRRGQSRRPLFISTVGCNADEAANWVGQMHGSHRIPTLLRLVDRVARTNDVGETR